MQSLYMIYERSLLAKERKYRNTSVQFIECNTNCWKLNITFVSSKIKSQRLDQEIRSVSNQEQLKKKNVIR